MSTGSGAQSTDVSGPWNPVAPSFQQHQRWEQELNQTFNHQTYGAFLPPPLQYRSSPYSQPSYPRTPYSPYAMYGGPPVPMYHPPSMFSFSSHQPRPPPAIRSGHVDALIDSSRSASGMHHGARAHRGSYPTGSQGPSPSATGYFPYSMPSQSTTTLGDTSNMSFDGGQFAQAMSGGVEQSSRVLPLHPGSSGSNQPQRSHQNRERQTGRNAEVHHTEYAEPRTPRNLTAQVRRSERSSSPRTSARRSYDRYSGDLSQSSTSSDVEEAAARSPPSSRIRHRPRESRPRLFSQVYDPNVITSRQIQELKTSLPKLLLGELPEDTSPTCDICAKDYSATLVQPSEEDEIAVKLPCGHSFGEFCIGQWVCKFIPWISLR